MSKPGPRQGIAITDDRGRRLQAVWSRSGKNLIFSVGTARFDPYGQALLDPQQVDAMAAFLRHTLSPEAPPQLTTTIVGEVPGTLDLTWKAPRASLEVLATPARYRRGEKIAREHLIGLRDAATRIELNVKQAEDLVESYMSATVCQKEIGRERLEVIEGTSHLGPWLETSRPGLT